MAHVDRPGPLACWTRTRPGHRLRPLDRRPPVSSPPDSEPATDAREQPCHAPVPPLQTPASRPGGARRPDRGARSGGYLYERHRTGSIYHPHARFIPEPTPTLPTHGPARFAWPLYGYSKEHTRFFPAPARVFPPFKQLWVRTGDSLLEFPPSLHGDHIFQLADDGVLSAINLHTGHTFWQRRIGSLSASTPAAVGNVVYATVLARPDGTEKGEIVALCLHHWQDPVVARATQPKRVIATRGRWPRVLRLPERHGLRAGRAQRQRHLGLPRIRRRQGQPDAL